jgi:hypothetical protein
MASRVLGSWFSSDEKRKEQPRDDVLSADERQRFANIASQEQRRPPGPPAPRPLYSSNHASQQQSRPRVERRRRVSDESSATARRGACVR